MTEWERVEEALAWVCMIFSDTKDAKAYDIIARVFGSIESSAGRRTALERISEIYFHSRKTDPRMIGRFKKLIMELSSASRLRDDIAHGAVSDFLVSWPHKLSGAFLVPSSYNSARNMPMTLRMTLIENSTLHSPSNSSPLLPGAYRYTSEDINEIANKFRELHLACITYVSDLMTLTQKTPESSKAQTPQSSD